AFVPFRHCCHSISSAPLLLSFFSPLPLHPLRPALFSYPPLFRSVLSPDFRAFPRRLGAVAIGGLFWTPGRLFPGVQNRPPIATRSEEHTSELQSPRDLVCPPPLQKKKKTPITNMNRLYAKNNIGA